MALRSTLRKIPALGLTLRSPPMGPLTGPVRALSPAAGPRLMSSNGAHIEGLIDNYRRELALSHASIDATMRDFEKNHRSVMKKLDIIEKASGVVLAACPAAIVLMMINSAN